MINLFSNGDPQGMYGFHYVYFHCDVEDHVDAEWNKKQPKENWRAPDLISSDTERDSLEDGVHEVMVYGRKAFLYIWTWGTANFLCAAEDADEGRELIEGNPDSVIHTRKGPGRQGLVVFEEDKLAVEYAKKKLAAKSQNL